MNNQDQNNQDQKQFKCAYLVGVTEDGQFVFDITGDQIGLVELLGLHQFAAHRISRVVDDNQGTGDAITNAIYKMLNDGVAVQLSQDDTENLSQEDTKKSNQDSEDSE